MSEQTEKKSLYDLEIRIIEIKQKVYEARSAITALGTLRQYDFLFEKSRLETFDELNKNWKALTRITKNLSKIRDSIKLS